MGLGKILKIFKKGSKATAKKKGKDAAGATKWPSGTRIGIYGHHNSGKTVYFTVLNEESKVAKDLQISVTDNPTSAEFLANRRNIWGLGTSTTEGTVVDQRGEQKFPEPTEEDRVLQFNAIVDRNKTLSIVTYDYPGKAVSISETSPVHDKVAEFMKGCNGILFFFDPKTLASELQSQAHVASFVNMLESIAPLEGRLPIPVGLVITKSDILDGFNGEEKVVLVGDEHESYFSEDFELFLEKVLASNNIAGDSVWAGSVRKILVKMRDFLRVVVGRTLNFQIFFISNTGDSPEKVGSDVGRSIYLPPKRIRPVGVRAPFHWLLKAVLLNRRISGLRAVAKYVALFSLIWALLYSLPFMAHLWYYLPKATNVEDAILERHRGSIYTMDQSKLNDILKAYGDYRYARLVRLLYPNYPLVANSIMAKYQTANTGKALEELEMTIQRFSDMVAVRSGWPGAKVGDTVLIDNDEKRRFLEFGAVFETFVQSADKTSDLFLRSERVQWYYNKFREVLFNPESPELWTLIRDRIKQDTESRTGKLSEAERLLHAALGKQEVVKKVVEVAREAANELDQIAGQINDNGDPEYRLKDAVSKLRTLKDKLLGNPDKRDDIQRIDRYIEQVNWFTTPRTYKVSIVSIPPDHHLHIAVKKRGGEADWKVGSQLYQGEKFTIEWKMRDEILIALDAKHLASGDETWGKSPKELIKLDKYSAIFDLKGTVTFNSGLKATFDLEEDLTDRLPVIK